MRLHHEAAFERDTQAQEHLDVLSVHPYISSDQTEGIETARKGLTSCDLTA